jgi:predicted Zn-dependent protease with MMP-like domain
MSSVTLTEYYRTLDEAWDFLDEGNYAAAVDKAKAARAFDEDAESLVLLWLGLTVQKNATAAANAREQAIANDLCTQSIVRTVVWLIEADREGEALAWCETAIDCAEDEGDYIEAVLFKAEILLDLERDAEARELVLNLPPVQYPRPELHLAAADLLLEVDEPDLAEAHFKHVLDFHDEGPDDEGMGHEPLSADERTAFAADALHGLGKVAGTRGDEVAHKKFYAQAYEKVKSLPAPKWPFSDQRLEEIVAETLSELPPRAQQLLKDVPILVEDLPNAQLVMEDGVDPMSLGIFAGNAYGEGTLGGPVELRHIVLYRHNLARAANDDEDMLAQQVHNTLLSEIVDFFGISEEELETAAADEG